MNAALVIIPTLIAAILLWWAVSAAQEGYFSVTVIFILVGMYSSAVIYQGLLDGLWDYKKLFGIGILIPMVQLRKMFNCGEVV